MEPAIAYFVRPSARLAVVTYRTQPDFEEWLLTMERLFREPDFLPGFGILFDRSSITHPADTVYMKRLVHFLDTKRADGTIRGWAGVVGDVASFGMGRMAEQLTQYENSVRIFRDVTEAEAWLSSAA